MVQNGVINLFLSTYCLFGNSRRHHFNL